MHTTFQKRSLDSRHSKKDSNTETEKSDSATSEACTRSGTFALLISIVLFVLATSWLRVPIERSLNDYLVCRQDLTIEIERLDDDPIWQKYKVSNADTESSWLIQLPTEVTITTQSEPSDGPKSPPSHTSKPGKLHQTWIAPPSFLRVTSTQHFKLDEIAQITRLMQLLNDSSLINGAADYSNYFNISIIHWAQKRADLLYQNGSTSSCATEQIEAPHQSPLPDGFIPQINKNILLSCLKLSDLRFLAQYELPEVTNPDQLGGHIGRDVSIAPGALPTDRYLASLISNALLIFVLVYFRAFAKEASLSASFPANGTLFGAFSRSFWTLLILFIALCIPLIASLSVAIESKRLWLAVESVFVLSVTIWTIATLQRRSYWTISIHGYRIRPRTTG